jgi:branched-chain amino acid transport system permease protein
MSSNRLIRGSGLAVLIVVLFLSPVLLNIYWISVLAIALINILLAVSLRTIKLLDLISLGHVGFTLVGAYGSALLVIKWGLPFWASLILAGLMSSMLALILGYPFLKVKGIYFAVLTLLTAETFRLIAYHWRKVTGGQIGLTRIPSPGQINIPGIGALRFDDITGYYYIIIVVVLVSLVILYKIEHSHLNFKWRAIRDAEGLALSVGINSARYKVINFSIACFFAGIAGSLFAHYQHNLSADFTSRFGVWTSIYLLVYMVVGGVDSFAGPIVGTFVIVIISELLRSIGEYQPMVIGGIAIAVMLFIPEGIVGVPHRFKSWVEKQKGQVKEL